MITVLGVVEEDLVEALVIHASRVGVVHAEHGTQIYGFGDAFEPLVGSIADASFRMLIEQRLASIDSQVRSVRAHLAVPFDINQAATARIPQIQVTITRGVASVLVVAADEDEGRSLFDAFLRDLEAVSAVTGDPDVLTVLQHPSPQEYAQAVTIAKSRFDTGFDKVVLARSMTVQLTHSADPALILRTMADREPFCTRYAQTLDGVRFIGASPELLIRRSGSHFSSQPLAGTASARALVEELIESNKDNAEHRIVVEEIVERLDPFAETLEYPSYPEVMALRSVIHLATRITGTLQDSSTSALDLLAAICPTPAVSGRPIDTARSLIAELEPVDRGFFAGAMGWMDRSGNGAFVLAIRGVFLQGDSLTAIAGAGIVADSDPQAEVAETEMKLRSILDAAAPEASTFLP